MTKRTLHGEERHADAGRPTSEALSDKATASEIYLDAETGYYVFIGARGRAHIFTIEGSHHTSFRATQHNRKRRVDEGKWERIERDKLPESLE